MNDLSGPEHCKLLTPPHTHIESPHMESSGTHKWATVMVNEVLIEKRDRSLSHWLNRDRGPRLFSTRECCVPSFLVHTLTCCNACPDSAGLGRA